MRKLRLKWAFTIALFCAALPTVAQHQYYTFGPNFWEDKEFVYDSGYCNVHNTGELYSTVVELPQIAYDSLHENTEYGVFLSIEDYDESVWIGWDFGSNFYLEEESIEGTNRYMFLNYDGVSINHLNSTAANYGPCSCYMGTEDTGEDCGCLDGDGVCTNFCRCVSPYFEISDEFVPSTYSQLRVIIYRVVPVEE